MRCQFIEEERRIRLHGPRLVTLSQALYLCPRGLGDAPVSGRLPIEPRIVEAHRVSVRRDADVDLTGHARNERSIEVRSKEGRVGSAPA
jgi:hypothetical protein